MVGLLSETEQYQMKEMGIENRMDFKKPAKWINKLVSLKILQGRRLGFKGKNFTTTEVVTKTFTKTEIIFRSIKQISSNCIKQESTRLLS
jgi:hypothetical protein